MNPSIEHMLAAVIRSLESDVLPHLDPQTSPAGNLRACLMLLANIEARVTHEPRQLFDDNLELRALLTEAAETASALGLDPRVTSALHTALQAHPPQTTWFDADTAARENRSYQEALTQVIEHLKGGSEFRDKLRAYLQRLGQRDMTLVASALNRTPV